MSESLPTEFLLPASFLIEGMVTPGRLVLVRESQVRLTLLDTFDRRLLKAGAWLAIERDEDGLSRCVCQCNQGLREVLPWSGKAPVFAAELGRLDCHDWLAPILGVRALMPQVDMTGTCADWVIEAADGVAVLALGLDSLAVRHKRRKSPLQARLRLIPVKGHRKEFRALAESLCTEPTLEVADTSLYQSAVWVLSNAWPVTVIPPAVITDPEMRADGAVKQVLLQLLETMQVNEAGLLAEIDTEFLHDYRVAVRRTRAVLGQMGAALPPSVLQRFRDGFADLARATSGARDLDVFLLALAGLDAQLPSAMQGQLQPLREEVMTLSHGAHEALNARLGSTTHHRFLQAWASFLERPVPRRPTAEKARVPIGALAGAKIWKLYRRLLQEGKSINPESPPEALHTLRKTAKKLRYQMELFQGLYPADEMQPLLRRLKKLQTHLGDYQDMSVQVGHLRELAEVLRDRSVPMDTLLAIGALLGHLHHQESHLRDRFEAWFYDFSNRRHRRKFRHLFRPAVTSAVEDKRGGKGID
jgi:CHAD domain-containing protein